MHSQFDWSKIPDTMNLQEWFQNIPSCNTYFAHNVTEIVGCGAFWVGTGLATQHTVGLVKDLLALG